MQIDSGVYQAFVGSQNPPFCVFQAFQAFQAFLKRGIRESVERIADDPTTTTKAEPIIR